MVHSALTESLHGPSKDLQIYKKKKILLRPELSLTHIWKKRSLNDLPIQITFISKVREKNNSLHQQLSGLQQCARFFFKATQQEKTDSSYKMEISLFASTPRACQNNHPEGALIPVAISHWHFRNFTDEPATAPQMNCEILDKVYKSLGHLLLLHKSYSLLMQKSYQKEMQKYQNNNKKKEI